MSLRRAEYTSSMYRDAVCIGQAVDYWVTVHSLKSLDGGILDQDDRLVDVVDDREQVSNACGVLSRES